RGLFHRLRLRRSLLNCLVVLFLLTHEVAFAFSASRSFTTVRMRAISRFASRSRAEFSSAPVTDWKRRLNSSCRRSASRCSSSSSLRSRSSDALVKELSLSLHDFRLHGQLLPREAERLLGERLGNARELEHHAPGLDHGDPAL